jgi:phosphohistidine phosphatase
MEEAPPGKELLLLRHAKASRGATKDFDRELTRRGRRDAPRIGRWLKTEGLVPDCVIGSPARRARETLELALDEFGIEAGGVRWDERVYDADASTLLEVLAGCPAEARRVLVVGHNPGLEDLVRHLGGGTAPEPEKGKFFPTCALARLRVESPWSALAAGATPVVAIVSWSRKDGRWRIRAGAEPRHG